MSKKAVILHRPIYIYIYILKRQNKKIEVTKGGKCEGRDKQVELSVDCWS